MRWYEEDYNLWEQSVPATLRDDPLWSVHVYRLGLSVADLAWPDATKLAQDGRTRSLSDQLYRAVGSISANTSEGYSRGSSKDRTRFYEYALGSARECRGWYWKGRHVLGEEHALSRMELLTDIVRLLLRMTSQQRGYMVREDTAEYAVNYDHSAD
ncbi:MAG: four helix bundle protein [Armatimonadetes bacterium]|nr:four helix bundle protein [Armatimonadota bacterium]